jgi:hypothetical protein
MIVALAVELKARLIRNRRRGRFKSEIRSRRLGLYAPYSNSLYGQEKDRGLVLMPINQKISTTHHKAPRNTGKKNP